MRTLSIIAFAVALSLWPARAWAEESAPKPKYGPAATVISKSHDYIRRAPAPDYWALSPYYAAQMNERACSLASATMVVNAARVSKKLTSDDELATQTGLLARVKSELWNSAVGEGGKGVTLAQLGPLVEQSLKVYGFDDVTVEVVHANDKSKATAAKLRRALAENERSANDFIIANFVQGVFTGDANVGHIAPIAAYDAAKRRVLVMDPDRQWYEPYWVSEKTLLEGMATLDGVSEKYRGYVWVKLGSKKKK